MDEARTKRVNCFKCRYYYVTWDADLPRGCKAMDFKSREMPSSVVFASSGVECQMFVPNELHRVETEEGSD